MTLHARVLCVQYVLIDRVQTERHAGCFHLVRDETLYVLDEAGDEIRFYGPAVWLRGWYEAPPVPVEEPSEEDDEQG